jgi:hypothetical protein
MGEMRKGGSNHLEGGKKFGAPTLAFFGPHHKFLEFIFLGSKFNVLLQFVFLFEHAHVLQEEDDDHVNYKRLNFMKKSPHFPKEKTPLAIFLCKCHIHEQNII